MIEVNNYKLDNAMIVIGLDITFAKVCTRLDLTCVVFNIVLNQHQLGSRVLQASGDLYQDRKVQREKEGSEQGRHTLAALRGINERNIFTD